MRDAVRDLADSDLEQRAEVFVDDRGRTEGVIGGSLALLTVRMSDLGPVGANRPAVELREDAGPDVVSDLRPSEARKLAAALLNLADRLDPPPVS